MDKRQAAIATVAVAAASIVTSAAFESPAELLEPVPVVETLGRTDSAASNAGADEEAGTARKTLLGMFRARVLRIPAEARALVGVPLLLLGQGLTAAASFLWTGVSAPALTKALEWILMLAVAAAVFAASVKAALPEIPVREIAKPRNFGPLLGLTLLLATADLALSTLWEAETARWIWYAGSGGILAGAVVWTVRRERRRLLREKEEQAALEAARPLSRSAIEALARRLADSVCRPQI